MLASLRSMISASRSMMVSALRSMRCQVSSSADSGSRVEPGSGGSDRVGSPSRSALTAWAISVRASPSSKNANSVPSAASVADLVICCDSTWMLVEWPIHSCWWRLSRVIR